MIQTFLMHHHVRLPYWYRGIIVFCWFSMPGFWLSIWQVPSIVPVNRENQWKCTNSDNPEQLHYHKENTISCNHNRFFHSDFPIRHIRSEERRVGKEYKNK